MTALVDDFRDRAVDVMARGGSILPLLEALVIAVAADIPGSHVGVNILDKPGKTFRYSLFPSLPADFSKQLVGNPITGKRGSCGLAILSGKVIEVPEVATDARFSSEWKSLFHQHRLLALASFPALSKEGDVQGTLAVIYDPQRPLNPEQRHAITCASRLCAQLCAYSRTQEANQILIAELDHRMRNLFSTIGAVAVLTARHYPEFPQFRRTLDNRLLMMQKAHALALADKSSRLTELLAETLAPYMAETAGCYSGPDIILAPEAASALALVLHELATNAAKYGAFSQPGGAATIRWHLEDHAEEGCQFRFAWQEHNGPPVCPPQRKGYGSLMIHGSLRNAFDGKAEFAYHVEGLRCTISAPFSARLGKAAEGECVVI